MKVADHPDDNCLSRTRIFFYISARHATVIILTRTIPQPPMAAKKKLSVSVPLPIDAPERRRLPILLRHAWYSLNQTFRRRLAHTGVTPDQFTALRTLSEHGPAGMTQSELTRLLASDPNTIGALVERMERCGWVARAPHEKDRRPNRLRLLPAGLSQYKR